MIGVYWSVLFLAVLSTEILSESDAGCICFNTSVYNYTILLDKEVQIQHGQTRLQFELRAGCNAHVLLMESCTNKNDLLYDIIIGGWSNTMSAVRIANQKNSHNVNVNITVQTLNCSKMNSFWIDWQDNVIKVGNGFDVGSNQFMYLDSSGKKKIQYLAISTQNYTGYWMFNASKSTVTENNTSQEGDNSSPDIQMTAQTTGNTVTSLTEKTTTNIGHISITDAKPATETAGNTVTSVTSTVNSINTHGIVPSTPTIETTATIPANNSTYLRVNRTETEREMQLKTAIELIRKELKMEKKNLSSTIRKKTSARDERVSAKTIGFTLGVCVLTTVFGTIIMCDLVSLGKFIWKRFQ